MVPPAIADDLRRKKPIPSKKYEDITLMFSAIDGFEAFSASHEPLDIVILLNNCYTIFDTILDPAIHPKIYKVSLSRSTVYLSVKATVTVQPLCSLG